MHNSQGKKMASCKKSRRSVTTLSLVRSASHQTLLELSEATGLSRSYLSLLEGGHRRFNKDTILILAKHFNIDPAIFLEEDIPLLDTTRYIDLETWRNFFKRPGLPKLPKDFDNENPGGEKLQ